MAINPADSQKCANELAGKDPFTVVSTLNFFGNQFPIYDAAGIKVIVANPITVGDYTAPGVFSIGAGGGCFGVHTALVYAATQEIKAKRVAVPWADTPPGVVCYYDLEKKPLDVLQGSVPGDSELAGTIPDLEHIGVPIKPASPDVTPQATQVLDFDPDAIIFSAQGADCWNFVDALGRLGWTPEQTPLLLSGACTDFEKMRAAGDLAKGVYFVGAAGGSLTSPDAIEDPRIKMEAQTYVDKAKEFGVSDADITKGFSAQAWSVMMTLWEQANIVVNEGGELTSESFSEQFSKTSENHLYGSVPFGCADAVEPYSAVCSFKASMTQWDGSTLVPVIPSYSGIDLVAGTELKPGP
jgi:branched-chain amino acid transport system substrate-binding protein